MIDPDEMAAYEVWKHNRLVGTTDLSVHAFNTEQEIVALAYEAGVRDAFIGQRASKTVEEVIARNPNRTPGMMGHNPGRRITS